MKILITGCNGLLGSNFCVWLMYNTKHIVIGVDDESGGETNLISGDRFIYFKYNAANAGQMKFIFDVYTPKVVFHFAAYAAEGRSNYIRTFIHKNNTVSAANIINFCVNYKSKLVFTSSVAVYSGMAPYDEKTIPNPIDEYGLSKWTTERSIQIAGEQQGLDWCIIRPRNVYGENQSIFDEARNVMGIWMYQIKSKMPMTIFGNGLNHRCFTYIGDILKPMYNAIKVSKEIINLGSPIAFSILDANELLQEVTGHRIVKYLPQRHEVKDVICKTEKSIKLLGYEHKTYLDEGLKKMWEWAKNIPLRQRNIPPSLEIKTNTHSSIK